MLIKPYAPLMADCQNIFAIFDLDLLSSDPNINTIGILCYPGWMCGLSLRKVGQGVLELLIGNKKFFFSQEQLNKQDTTVTLTTILML